MKSALVVVRSSRIIIHAIHLGADSANVFSRKLAKLHKDQGGEMDRSGVAHRNAMHALMQEFRFDQDKGKWYRRGEGKQEIEDEADLIDEVFDFFENLIPSDVGTPNLEDK